MSPWNGRYETDKKEHRPCAQCGDEQPVGVLEDELCPTCVDDSCDEWDEDDDQ